MEGFALFMINLPTAALNSVAALLNRQSPNKKKLAVTFSYILQHKLWDIPIYFDTKEGINLPLTVGFPANSQQMQITAKQKQGAILHVLVCQIGLQQCRLSLYTYICLFWRMAFPLFGFNYELILYMCKHSGKLSFCGQNLRGYSFVVFGVFHCVFVQ